MSLEFNPSRRLKILVTPCFTESTSPVAAGRSTRQATRIASVTHAAPIRADLGPDQRASGPGTLVPIGRFSIAGLRLARRWPGLILPQERTRRPVAHPN